jgi:hypothetical protein
LSPFRTSTLRSSSKISTSSKIKFAVSSLALVAAAAGTVSVWPSSAAAQPAASSGQATGRVASLATAFGSQPEAAGDQPAVLDSITAVSAPQAVTKAKPIKHEVKVKHKAKKLTPKQIAWRMLKSFHWTHWQFRWLNRLWSRESSWNVYASNPYSGAYGIPQAVPGSKMASAGSDWEGSARTQIRWGLDYIKGRYGSPHVAWEHELSTGWY